MYFSPVLRDEGDGANYEVSLDHLYCFNTEDRKVAAVPIIKMGETSGTR
jgi:hypothetical protein